MAPGAEFIHHEYLCEVVNSSSTTKQPLTQCSQATEHIQCRKYVPQKKFLWITVVLWPILSSIIITVMTCISRKCQQGFRIIYKQAKIEKST